MTKAKVPKKAPRKRAPGGGRKSATLVDRHQVRHSPEEWKTWEEKARALGFAGPSAWLRDIANRVCRGASIVEPSEI